MIDSIDRNNKKKYLSQYYKENREVILRRSKKWYMDNKTKRQEYDKKYHKEYYSKHKQEMGDKQKNRRLIDPDGMRNTALKNKYKITLSDYNDLLLEQNGRCAICGKDRDFGGQGNKLHVDHDHKTGSVRGLLCNGCNVGLAHFGDNVNSLSSAIEYLRRVPCVF